MKEFLISTLMLVSLGIAILIPSDTGILLGLARGALLTIFIYTIPDWVKVRTSAINER